MAGTAQVRQRPRIIYDSDVVRHGKAIFDRMTDDEQEWYRRSLAHGLTLDDVYGSLAVTEAIARGNAGRSVREGLEAIS